jgi:foldase protein PrsA
VTRTLARLCAVAAAASVLAGCGGTGVGVAARLGDERITTETVTTRVERGLSSPAARRVDPVELQRNWLSQLLKLRLYREAARRLGALPSDTELKAMIDRYVLTQGGREAMQQQYQSVGVDPRDLDLINETTVMYELVGDALVRDVPTEEAALRKEYARLLPELDQAHIAHIKVKDQATADRIAAQVRAGGDFAKLAEQSIDVATATKGGDLGAIGNGPGRFEKVLVEAVFKASTGAVLGPIRVRDGFEIVKVIERQTISFPEARDLLRRNLVGEEREKRRSEYLRTLLADLGMSVSPRYGHWDEKEFRVTEGGDALSSPMATAGAAP